MKVIPVLDILNGEVVRGVAGRRSEYRPIISQLTQSTDPVNVALAIRHTFGLRDVYLADLDGILSQQPNEHVYRGLIEHGFDLTIDNGAATPRQVADLRKLPGTRAIASLECCPSPNHLADCVRVSDDIVFSLDLIRGVPKKMLDSTDWKNEPLDIFEQAIDTGIRSIIVLDLADVGMGTGGSTDDVCTRVKKNFPQIELIAGGGVRRVEDLVRLRQKGLDGALVASALHDRRLSKTDIEQFSKLRN
jgi:phosphoribosylformimino-5-aminoimidazole carboxamide ribotide isomerase